MGVFLTTEGNLTESQKHQADRLNISYQEMKEMILRRLETGIFLRMDGSLTSEQKEKAKKLNISYDKYKELLVNVNPERTYNIPKTDKCNELSYFECDRPVLVVGHGKNWKQELKKLKEWNYTVIATDSCVKEMIDIGIYPDYIVTLEASRQTCPLYSLSPDILNSKMKIIHSSITRIEIINKFKDSNIPIEFFYFKEESRCSNVGLFAINFAINKLMSDKVFLIGFEHMGDEYDEELFKLWKADFLYFIKKWPKNTIVNCSNGGVLYWKDYMVQSTLEKVKINE